MSMPFCEHLPDDIIVSHLVPIIALRTLGRLALTQRRSATNASWLCSKRMHWPTFFEASRPNDKKIISGHGRFRARAAPVCVDSVDIRMDVVDSANVLNGMRRAKRISLMCWFDTSLRDEASAAVLEAEHLCVQWYNEAPQWHDMFALCNKATFANLKTLDIRADTGFSYRFYRDPKLGPAFPHLERLVCKDVDDLIALVAHLPDRPLKYWKCNIQSAFLWRRLKAPEIQAKLPYQAADVAVIYWLASRLDFNEVQEDGFYWDMLRFFFSKEAERSIAGVWDIRVGFLFGAICNPPTPGWSAIRVLLGREDLLSSDYLIIALARSVVGEKLPDGDLGTLTPDEDAETDCLRNLTKCDFLSLEPDTWEWLLSEPWRVAALLESSDFWGIIVPNSRLSLIPSSISPSHLATQGGLRRWLSLSHLDYCWQPWCVAWLHGCGCHDLCQVETCEVNARYLESGRACRCEEIVCT